MDPFQGVPNVHVTLTREGRYRVEDLLPSTFRAIEDSVTLAAMKTDDEAYQFRFVIANEAARP
jgi:hypothetical protein